MNETIKSLKAKDNQREYQAFFDAAQGELDAVVHKINLMLAAFSDAEIKTLCDRASERYNAGCPIAHFIAEVTADEYGRRFNGPGAA